MIGNVPLPGKFRADILKVDYPPSPAAPLSKKQRAIDIDRHFT